MSSGLILVVGKAFLTWVVPVAFALNELRLLARDERLARESARGAAPRE